MKAPPASAFSSALVLTGLIATAQADTASAIDWSKAQTVEIRMIEYQFIPDRLTLRHGQPYRLHLVNAGKEGHDFTAPDFFQSAIVEHTGAFNDSRSSVFCSRSRRPIFILLPRMPDCLLPVAPITTGPE